MKTANGPGREGCRQRAAVKHAKRVQRDGSEKRASIPCAILLALTLARAAGAADHLDAPTVIADPAADIGDLFAWMAPDGRHLNLVMDIVGKGFSDQVEYVFHLDSGHEVGEALDGSRIVCRFDLEGSARCEHAGDLATGKVEDASGFTSASGRYRVFAGLRDDPFANNVRGTRQAYEAVQQALQAGAARDAAGCPAFDAATADTILTRWRHTDGGPPRNFLAGWSTGALVVTIDLAAVVHDAPLLAVWASTHRASDGAKLGDTLDRMGRPLTGNALLGPLEEASDVDRRKEAYNRAPPARWPDFTADIERTLALYDGFDGVCGNQWLAREAAAPRRYRKLAALLADDRLWIDTRATRCERFLAVELGGRGDCGGRTPASDAVDIYRSLLVDGSENGLDDGVAHDDKTHSNRDFPFLARPDAQTKTANP